MLDFDKPCGFLACTHKAQSFGPVGIMQRWFPLYPLSLVDGVWGYVCWHHYDIITTDRTSLYGER